MNIEVSGHRHLSREFLFWIDQHVAASLGRLSRRIKRIRVRFSDLNGPRRGLDQKCQVQVGIAGEPPIVVHSVRLEPGEAFHDAIERAGECLRRRLDRARDKRKQRKAAQE